MSELQKPADDPAKGTATPSGVRGECRLCNKESFLCNSHLMPAVFFRLLRSATLASKDPLVISTEVTFASSRQVSDYLLCVECEARLRSGGEGWVLQNCYRIGESFKLRDMVRRCKLLHDSEVAGIYSAATNSEIDISRLAYFAVSVFWRAAVHTWQLPVGRAQTLVSLGPYQEELRQFLLTDKSFPSHAVLFVWVSRLEQPSRLVTLPHSSRIFDCRVHAFDVPGIRFDLFVAQRIEDDLRLMCLATGKDHPILLSDAPDDIAATHVARISSTSRISKTLQKLGKWSWSRWTR